MLEIALGWLGWPLQTALTCDVNAIHVAYKGRKDMFYFIFGKPKALRGRTAVLPPSVGQLPKLTPAAFDSLFGPSPVNQKDALSG